jgi:hypothetical protein
MMSGPMHDKVAAIHDAIRNSVEEHFNKGLSDKKHKKYLVHDIHITSRAEINYMLDCIVVPDTRFIVRLFDWTTTKRKYISCIVTMSDLGSLQIQNIYYSDDGQPVEGFTKT